MFGIEGGSSLGSQELHAPRLPWSHSLASTGVLALGCAALGAAIGGESRLRLALLAFIAAAAHWLVGDVPFGEAFALTPWTTPLSTPHLYAHWPVAFVLEAICIGAGIVVAAPILGRRALPLAGALLALHILVWFPSFVGRAPIDLDAEPYAITTYLVLLVAAWVACVIAIPSRGPARSPR
jgi:hypothetical protein